jgi:tRNA threonylcarbamoyladenosine biosynthesis protein TsaB
MIQHGVSYSLDDMQGITLVLEASTADASVAVLVDHRLRAAADVASRDPHTGVRTEGLAPAIVKTVDEAGLTMAQIDAIVCSSGPGGFTSLRSAAAIAKGICTALDIPLLTVPTAALMVAGAQLPSGTYLTALDAGRREYYATLVEVEDAHVQQVGAVTLVSLTDLDRIAREAGATLLGVQLSNSTAVQGMAQVHPHASALQFLDDAHVYGPVDLDRWEPTYGRLAEAQVKWEAAHGRALQW